MSGSSPTRVSVSQATSKVVITSPPTTIVKTSPTYSPLPQNFYIRAAKDVATNLTYLNGYVLTWNGLDGVFDLEAPSGGGGGGGILSGNTSSAILLNNNQTANTTANVVSAALPTANANGLYMFQGQIGARDVNTNNSKVWSIEGGVKTGKSNSMNFIGSPIINTIAADNGTNNWIITLLVDSANAHVIVHGTGSTNTINWVSNINVTEIG